MPSRGDIGARVLIQGLTSPAGQRMNNSMGNLISYDMKTGRFGVKLDGVPGAKSIKQENLMLLAAENSDAPQTDIQESLHDDMTPEAVNAQVSNYLLRSGSTHEKQSMRTVVIHYSQCKSWMRDALLKIGCKELDSGAKILVPDETLQTVVTFLEEEGWELKTSHVVVVADLEIDVTTAVEEARKKTSKRERGGSCKVEAHVELSIPVSQDIDPNNAAVSADEAEPFCVRRSFVDIPVPFSLPVRSISSIHAATV